MPSKNNVSALRSGSLDTKPILDPEKPKAGAVQAPRKKRTEATKRINKGFQVEQGRAERWDTLVAQMKNKKGNNKRKGPELIDEALDYLFAKYLK